MRKFIVSFCLILSFSFFVAAQTNDEIAYWKADSTKKELKKAKGKKLVDCYNMLAECYFWIWDDDDRHFDTACMYKNKALEEAKKINYKAGIAYAKANLRDCRLPMLDVNRDNNDIEPAYIQINRNASEVLSLAAELKDDYLVGLVYYELAWIEKWWGSSEKFKETTQKAIQHLEKINGDEFRDKYKPLIWDNCVGCKGTESLLGWLYVDLLRTEPGSSSTRKIQIEKAIYYNTKIGKKNLLAGLYLSLGNLTNTSISLGIGIEYLEKALKLYRESDNHQGELAALNDLCGAYWNLGDFENGLSFSRRGLELAKKIINISSIGLTDSLRLGQAYYWTGRFYEIAGDYATALSFFNKAKTFYPIDTRYVVALGELHRKAGNFDSAKVYLLQFEKRDGGKPMLANLYVSLKQYDDALRILSIVQDRNRENNLGMGRNFLIIAEAYLGKSNYEMALTNARKGVTFLSQMKRNIYLIDGYKVLSDVFERLGNTDSAFHYFKKYSSLKDSLLNRQFYFRLNDYKKEAEELKKIGKIRLLEKDNFIKEQMLEEELLLKQQNEVQLALLDKTNQLKDQQLKEEGLIREQNRSQLTLLDKENKLKDQQLKQQSFLRNALIAGLFLLLVLGIFIIRNIYLKRKNDKLQLHQKEQQWKVKELQNENKHVEMEKQAVALEMQALRAQMNPHFIFNCLSSINRFILKNESKIASNYLTRFSRLMRMVLNNSQKSLISLDDELEMLELYLEMERLRFKNSFDYGITFLNTVDSDNIFIPPLLLQPFCENAIWHGLMNKQEQGRLDIELSIEDNILNCVIRDNGVGRDKAKELKSKTAEKEKSMGLKITTERLALLNREKGLHTFYEIEDLKDEKGNASGTKVNLKISYKQTVEEYASSKESS